MRIHVDPGKCQGHTICAMRAPALFELDDIDGTAREITAVVPADQEENGREAAASCPEQAIAFH